MKNKIPQTITLAAIAGLLVIAGNIAQAQTAAPSLAVSVDQSVFPQITAQPVDQVVPIGSTATLSVQATNADGFQWWVNGVSIDGQTNSSLTIANAGINNVGLYTCEVFNGSESVPTRTASLDLETAASATIGSVPAASVTVAAATGGGIAPAGVIGGGPITVFGTPLLSGGKQSSCPGPYAGFVAYKKTTSQGWGWAPTSGVRVLTAADGSGRTDTKIQYCGAYGDTGCAQTTVTIPYPPFSPVYQFGIYFANNVPTTNAYPIVLTGFNP